MDLDPNLNNGERSSIDKLCTNYHDVFHFDGDKLTFTPVLKHKIPMTRDQAQLTKNNTGYHMYKKKEEVNKQVDKLIKK